MDESWTLVINLAKTDTYILVQKSMLHLFPLISARRLNPQTHEHTNERTNIFGLLYWFSISKYANIGINLLILVLIYSLRYWKRSPTD